MQMKCLLLVMYLLIYCILTISMYCTYPVRGDLLKFYFFQTRILISYSSIKYFFQGNCTNCVQMTEWNRDLKPSTLCNGFDSLLVQGHKADNILCDNTPMIFTYIMYDKYLARWGFSHFIINLMLGLQQIQENMLPIDYNRQNANNTNCSPMPEKITFRFEVQNLCFVCGPDEIFPSEMDKLSLATTNYQYSKSA